MRVSCGLMPSADSTRLALLAEELGYHRVWFGDSPLIYGDVWIAVARAAEATERVGLGTAVLVPHLRHVVATASAICTVEQLAPGRLEVALGTGFTARATLGKNPLPWSFVRSYVLALKALLAGEEVEVDGSVVKLMHGDEFSPPRPLPTTLVLAADAPKGVALTKELGLGHMCAQGVPEGMSDSRHLLTGTVLEDGETLESGEVIERLGAAMAVILHGTYEMAGEAVDGMPGGATWRAEIEKIPQAKRHLYVHQDHLVKMTDRDRAAVGPELAPMTFTGSPTELRARVAELEQQGVGEVIYWPTAPDNARELRAMARALM